MNVYEEYKTLTAALQVLSDLKIRWSEVHGWSRVGEIDTAVDALRAAMKGHHIFLTKNPANTV